MRPQELQASSKRKFSNLYWGNSFQEAVQAITGQINALSLEFVNTQLVSPDTELFTKILPQEFKVRGVSMPFVWSNYVDWPKICQEKYHWKGGSLREAAR